MSSGIDRDWTGDPAIHFLIIVRDRADGRKHPIDTLLPLERELYDPIRRIGTMRLPYATVRLESARRAIDDGTGVGDDDRPSFSTSAPRATHAPI